MSNLITTNKNPYRWIVFFFLFSSFALQFTTYLSWNPFIPLASNIFGFTASQSAMIIAMVSLGRMLFQIPGGVIVDIFSAKKLLIISLIILSLATAFVGLRNNYLMILIGQFCIGMAGVVVCPLCIKVIIDYFPIEEQNFISGLLNSAATIAVIITNTFIPIITYKTNWHIVFYLMSILCLVLAICIKFSLKLSTNKQKMKTSIPNFAEIKSLILQKKFLITISVHAGGMYTTWGINSWISMYLSHQTDLEPTSISKLMFIFGLCGFFSMAFSGRFIPNGFSNRSKFLFINLFLIVIFCIGLPFIKNTTILCFYIAILGIINFAYFGPLNILISNLVNRKIFATTIAISIFFWQITSIIQSIFVGKIIDLLPASISYNIVFLIISFGAIISCISLSIIMHQPRKLKNLFINK